MLTVESAALRKIDLIGVLDRICRDLELTETQFQKAKDRYEAVGAWLAGGDAPLFGDFRIYVQGSAALGTTVKPIKRNEHDVDLVAHMPRVRPETIPAVVKKAIGDRLKANERYRPILEEMARCWRLNYADEFHLDITPSIINVACNNGGELVPDKVVRDWCASNPRAYKALFEHRAALAPRMRLLEAAIQKQLRADVEPFPMSRGAKGILRRIVQILKRHRDHAFENQEPCLAPISIVITTLASRSYEYCVANFVYDSDFDLLCDVIRHMPGSIAVREVDGRRAWFIWNETTTGENFAEKWNQDSRRAGAFYAWHERALADIEKLASLDGLDLLTKSLRESFGAGPADRALAGLTQDITAARAAGTLSAGVAGLTVGSVSGATKVRTNTFFGE